ncbi:MAG: VCBS repeat-containing protein [Bacteroidota bacterium]
MMQTSIGRTTVPIFFLLSFIFLSCGKKKGVERVVESSQDSVSSVHPPLFKLLSSSETGITFQNVLTEGLNTNVLLYEYFYNGGGVAAADFNGDDFIDLYFTSNMGRNALYINQGNLTFQEVGELSGARGRDGPWKTGVTAVDINGDKRMDIYLCYSGTMPDPKRANQLFINQGNNEAGIPIFKEKAETYGLASTAFSNQGHFFDYDRDGDLDMLLLNHNPKSLPVLNEANTARELKKDDPLKGIRLFRQSQGKFTDVTQQSGIAGSSLCYGLGMGISDVNNDGWMDFYVSNDYDIPDYLYVNNKNGTFRDELANSLGHNSHFSMGNDIADVNNDGLPDIITLDMLPEDNRRQKLLMAPENYAKFDLNVRNGFHYQYMRNMFQLNNGNGTFSEIGQLAGISNTDWSWSALLADYDNDGWKDLFITNGYFRDYSNRDFVNYMETYRAVKGRLTRQDVLAIIKEMPSSNVVNYVFSNQKGQGFQNQTRKWGLSSPSNSNGAAYADLDNDGDLDLIVNNINQPAFIYQNMAIETSGRHYLQIKLVGNALNRQGIGAKVRIWSGEVEQQMEQGLSRGYLSSVSPILHFGIGEEKVIDSLVVTWSSGKVQTLTEVPVNQVLVLTEGEAGEATSTRDSEETYFTPTRSPFSFTHKQQAINDFDRQPLLLEEPSYSGPCMVKGDVNGDGEMDLFIGGALDQAASLFLQSSGGKFTVKRIAAFEQDKGYIDTDAVLIDVNKDGYLDLYVASGGYHKWKPKDEMLQDRLYINDGKGNFRKSPEALPNMPVSTGAVAVSDINRDGYEDLFVGGRVIPGRYPEAPASFILLNNQDATFSDQTSDWAPTLSELGMVTDAEWVDLNQDEQEELIIVGEWLPITVFAKSGEKLENKTNAYFNREFRGFWNTLYVSNLVGNKYPEIIVGNIGTNVQFEVSSSQPAELYFKDFDNNGSVDPFFCYYIQGNSYPYVTRDELMRQLAVFRPRFPNYESYADITMEDLFTQEDLQDAEYRIANQLETMLFVQTDGGQYDARPLPVQAQISPIHAIESFDYNQDGWLDLLLCGNDDHFKLRLGKMDANYGVLLQGTEEGGFKYIPQRISGFKLQGDVRSMVRIGDILLFGVNGAPVVAYKKERNL